MKNIKNIIMTASVSFLILSILSANVVADISEVIEDDKNDIIILDDFSFEDFEQNGVRENIDITKLTYTREEGHNEVTIELEVNDAGKIENRNDFGSYGSGDIDPFEDTNFTGSTVNYMITLETSENNYIIDYTDSNCTINSQASEDYVVSENKITVNFNLENSTEELISMMATATEMEIKSAMSFKIYMDIAPEILTATVSAEPSNAETGEDINFDVNVEDPLGLATGVYTYTWDFDDGNTITGKSPTHSFDLAGDYEVEVTVEDDNGETTTAYTSVTVTKGTNNNNGGSTNGDGSDSDDNNLFLFVGIIGIIVIIGIVALVFIIRR